MAVRADRSPAARHRSASVLVGIVLGLSPLVVSAHPPDTRPEALPPSSPTGLPFRPVNGPNDIFTASDLTMSSDRAWMSFSNPRGPRIDLHELDQHGFFPPGDVPADSTARALYERTLHPEVAGVTPAEKDDLMPPQPGAHVGIPSAAAATGALIGGLAILIKILTLGI